MDEIWTFQFARRIVNHQIPYRDFFMIVSPLKAQIDALILKSFFDQLIALRWIALLIALLNGFLLYITGFKLGFSKSISFLIICLFYFSFSYFPLNNYNWLSLLIITNLLLLLISNQDKSRALLIGFLTSLLILTKQSIGFYMIFGIIIYFSIIRYKYLLLALIGFFIAFIPQIFYFGKNGALKDFINIFFSNWIPFFKAYSTFNLKSILVFSFIIIFLFILCFILIKKIKDIRGKEYLVLLIIINLAVLGYSFPIIDFIHFSFILPYFALLVFMNCKVESKFILYFVLLLIIFRGCSWFNLRKNTISTEIPHLKNIPIDRELVKSIHTVTNFQKEQINFGFHPYEIDYRNVLFDLAMDRFGIKFDSMLKGNFGLNGEEEIISKISQDPKAIVIVHKNYTNRKEQTKITDYVKSCMIYQETIGNYYLVYRSSKK